MLGIAQNYETTYIIHQAQGLIFDCLAFYLNVVTKHCLTYTTLFRIYFKQK